MHSNSKMKFSPSRTGKSVFEKNVFLTPMQTDTHYFFSYDPPYSRGNKKPSVFKNIHFFLKISNLKFRKFYDKFGLSNLDYLKSDQVSTNNGQLLRVYKIDVLLTPMHTHTQTSFFHMTLPTV